MGAVDVTHRTTANQMGNRVAAELSTCYQLGHESIQTLGAGQVGSATKAFLILSACCSEIRPYAAASRVTVSPNRSSVRMARCPTRSVSTAFTVVRTEVMVLLTRRDDVVDRPQERVRHGFSRVGR